MTTAGYSCSFIPCELIAASGLRPRRLRPSLPPGQSAGMTAGLCLYVEAFLAAAGEADAVILSTLCDQMRRGGDLLPGASAKPFFLLNLPATWQGRPARELYLSELRRLGRFLESLGGLALNDARLAEVMRDFDERRRRLRQCHGLVPARVFSRAVQEFPFHDLPAPGAPSDGVPLGLVGGELIEEDMAILDAIESAGGRIALDATDGGLRGLPRPFDPVAMADDPLAELASAYFDTIPHAFRRPDVAIHEYLARAIGEFGLRGLIFRRYPWCDLWNAQIWPWRHSLNVPVLDLDMGGQTGAMARTRGRIEAFMEMLCHPSRLA